MQIRIGIVKEMNSTLECIHKLFDSNRKYVIVFCVYNVLECLQLLEQEYNLIDILIIEDDYSGINQYKILKEIKDTYFYVKIIFLSSDYNNKKFTTILDIGIDGYLLSNIYFSEFEYSIAQVLNGITYIDTRLYKYYQKYCNKTYVIECKLTNREKEVITCAAAGMYNKEIAYYLKIREETVKNHFSNIYRKMHVKDRTQAVVYAIKNDLLEL